MKYENQIIHRLLDYKAVILTALALILSPSFLHAELVTVKVVGSVQANDEIAASVVVYRPTDESVNWIPVNTGGQADLTPSVEYFIDIVPGMPDGNNYSSLLRRRVILTYGGESELIFEWKRTLVNFSLVNQDGAAIPNSVIKITVGSAGTTMISLSNVGSLLLPVTHGEYVDVSGEFSISGYTINVIPGRNGEQGLESLLYRTETLPIYSSSEPVNAAFVWKEIICPLSVVELVGVFVTNFSLGIGSGLGSSTAVGGDAIRLPVTDETEYPTMAGSYVAGFPVTLNVGGDLIGTNVFEVRTNETFGEGHTFTDGNRTFTTRCTPVDNDLCEGNVFTEDFETGLDGSKWTSNSGSNWSVIDDAGNSVLKHEAFGNYHNLLVLNPSLASPGSAFEMEVKVKLIDMRPTLGVDQSAGIFFNYSNVSGVESYYEVVIYRDHNENNTHHAILKYQDCDGNGTREVVSKGGGAFTGRPFDEYAVIKIKKEGSAVRVFINGINLGYTFNDAEYINGSVGLITTGYALYDDFRFSDCGRSSIVQGITCLQNWEMTSIDDNPNDNIGPKFEGNWITVDNTVAGEPDPFLEQTERFEDGDCGSMTDITTSLLTRLENGVPIQTLSAFTMEAKLQLVKWHVYYYSAAGVFFNNIGGGNFYAVFIRDAGTYIVKYVNGVQHAISPGYTPKPGNIGKFNRLRIVKEGGHIRVYFNDDTEPSVEAYDGEYINGTGGIISYYGTARFDCDFSFTNYATAPIVAQTGIDPAWTPLDGNWLTVDNKDDLGNTWLEQAKDIDIARLKRNTTAVCTPFTVESKFQFVGYPTSHNVSAGIFFNDDGNGNFYEAVVDYSGSLYVSKYVSGQSHLNFGFASVAVPQTLRFYSLKIEKDVNDNINVYYDNIKVLSALRDPETPYQNGAIGVTTHGKFARFDDFSFSSPCNGSITGYKWNDVDADGEKDNNESVLTGWTVYVDLDNNGFDEGDLFDVTDENGYYIDGVGPGTWKLSEVQQDGWEQTFPHNNNGDYEIVMGMKTHHIDMKFGNKEKPPCIDPPSGLVAWWPGDYSPLDISGKNNHLIVSSVFEKNSSQPYEIGKVKGSFDFWTNGGDDELSNHVPDSPILNFGEGDFSIDAWISVDWNDGGPIVEKRTLNPERGYYFFVSGGINADERKLVLRLADGGSEPGYSEYRSDDLSGITYDYQWYHVAVSVDRKGIGKFFVNGQPKGTFNPSDRNLSISNAANLTIGATYLSESKSFVNFQGYFDEIEIFSRALNESDVLGMYNADASGKCKSNLAIDLGTLNTCLQNAKSISPYGMVTPQDAEVGDESFGEVTIEGKPGTEISLSHSLPDRLMCDDGAIVPLSDVEGVYSVTGWEGEYISFDPGKEITLNLGAQGRAVIRYGVSVVVPVNTPSPLDCQATIVVSWRDNNGVVRSSNIVTKLSVKRDCCVGQLLGPISLDVPLLAGWNLVSLPVTVLDSTVQTVFEDVSENVFFYDGGYQTSSSLATCLGYWMKVPQAKYQSIDGTAVCQLSCPLRAGWNLIGAISSPVDVDNVETVPEGIIVSKFFEYNNGYNIADTLTPGKGYWVRASAVATMEVQDASYNIVDKGSAKELSNFHALTIIDARGNRQRLYIGLQEGQIFGDLYTMPPLPPRGIFDARFSSQTMVGLLPRSASASANLRVDLHDAVYPVTVIFNSSIDNMKEISIAEVINDQVQPFVRLLDMGTKSITNTQVLSFVISAVPDEAIPAIFSLRQNYPNPFNPVTTIHYEVPVPSVVSLKIYNTLGEQVAILVDEEQEAGIESVEWNSYNIPSGIYFYRMIAVSKENPGYAFYDVKKMVILK